MSQISAVVLRSIGDEEQIKFEGTYASNDDALAAVESQLALCRAHMIALNEKVRAIDVAKSDELTATLAAKGEELKRLDREIEEKTLAASKLGKKLSRVG